MKSEPVVHQKLNDAVGKGTGRRGLSGREKGGKSVTQKS